VGVAVSHNLLSSLNGFTAPSCAYSTGKGKFTLKKTTKAQRGRRVITLLFL
jgi:hypothetical protein